MLNKNHIEDVDNIGCTDYYGKMDILISLWKFNLSFAMRKRNPITFYSIVPLIEDYDEQVN